MEENRNVDSGGEQRGEDDNGGRCDCTGDCFKGLNYWEQSMAKQRGYSRKLIREKKKHVCNIWQVCIAAAGSSCWLEEKYNQQVCCFVFNYTATEKREHGFLSYLASFIVCLPSWWLRCITVLFLQSSLWPLVICILLTILLSWMSQEINWIAWLKQGTKLIPGRWVLSLVHWDLQTFPLHPLFLGFAV